MLARQAQKMAKWLLCSREALWPAGVGCVDRDRREGHKKEGVMD